MVCVSLNEPNLASYVFNGLREIHESLQCKILQNTVNDSVIPSIFFFFGQCHGHMVLFLYNQNLSFQAKCKLIFYDLNWCPGTLVHVFSLTPCVICHMVLFS